MRHGGKMIETTGIGIVVMMLIYSRLMSNSTD
jgi:hypothetical protein